MAITDCPTCGGEGFIAEDGPHPVSFYVTEGWIRRELHQGIERLVPTPKFRQHPDEFPLEKGELNFAECWCNQEIMAISQQAGAPLYWKNDQSGRSQRAVMKVWSEAVPDANRTTAESLSDADIFFLRGYCAQWVIGINRAKETHGRATLASGKWLPHVAKAETREDFMALDEMLAEYGLDPF